MEETSCSSIINSSSSSSSSSSSTTLTKTNNNVMGWNKSVLLLFKYQKYIENESSYGRKLDKYVQYLAVYQHDIKYKVTFAGFLRV
mmetsp:Transcript_13693/g.22969  ORF Transcript_13693/g.22969 Transcript_13693/m.22969 type:complete len:86 (-) Transcript_13693:1870-2127(-)